MPRLSLGLRLLSFCAAASAGCLDALPAAAGQLTYFTPGDLVISIYGNGDGSGPYGDNAAAPITLAEVSTSPAPAGALQSAGTLVLPQTTTTANGVTNYAISGEYGSSSEGTLQRSANGQYLTIAGYGVSAATFNADPVSYGGGSKTCAPSGLACFPLAQTSSVPGFASSSSAVAAGDTSATTITVPRVVALVGANGNVDTSTALTGVFNENNPRSVATVDGSVLYVSGQGNGKNDTATNGLFVANRGATVPSAQIYGSVSGTGYDTRTVSIQNNQLFLSTDTTAGSGVTENISSIGAAGNLPTTTTTPAILPNLKSKYTISASPTSTTDVSMLNAYDQQYLDSNPAFLIPNKTKGIIYLSPENYFFANSTTLYVADSGNPKGDNNAPSMGTTTNSQQGLSNGGLQKWSLVHGAWVLDYTLSLGLDLVPDTTPCADTATTCGSTGLIGLAGQVVGDLVELFATNATLSDLDQTYLYGISDVLSATLPSQVTGETFSVLQTAPAGTIIRGVSLAPVPEPASMALLATGALGGMLARRRRRAG